MIWLYLFAIWSIFAMLVIVYHIRKLEQWADETDEWGRMVDDYIVKTQGKDCIGFREE